MPVELPVVGAVDAATLSPGLLAVILGLGAYRLLKRGVLVRRLRGRWLTAAIRPATVDGEASVEIDEDNCMFCANCFSVCPALPLADPLNDGVSIWVGGKVSNARVEPRFSKLAIPFLPNNPPRWPEVVDAVRNIVDVWAKNAHKFERMGEFIERIGWPRFFKLTGIEFQKEHIDDFKYAGLTYKRSAQLRL